MEEHVTITLSLSTVTVPVGSQDRTANTKVDMNTSEIVCLCICSLYLFSTYILPFPLVACKPSCQNGGTCIAGLCICPRDYNGSYCQHSSFNNCECVCSECLCICVCLCEAENETVLTSVRHSPPCFSS